MASAPGMDLGRVRTEAGDKFTHGSPRPSHGEGGQPGAEISQDAQFSGGYSWVPNGPDGTQGRFGQRLRENPCGSDLSRGTLQPPGSFPPLGSGGSGMRGLARSGVRLDCAQIVPTGTEGMARSAKIRQGGLRKWLKSKRAKLMGNRQI